MQGTNSLLPVAGFADRKLIARDTPQCESNGDTASVSNVVACFNYLVALGHYPCPERDKPGAPRQLCAVGDVQIVATNAVQRVPFQPSPPIAESAWYVSGFASLTLHDFVP